MSPEHPPWWDPHSDQPYKLSKSKKPRLQADNLIEYAKTAATALTMGPIVGWHYASLKRPTPPDLLDFVGLGVSPDHGDPVQIEDLVSELGVKKLLLRIPSWHVNHIEHYLDFADRFKNHDLLINILQSKQSVQDIEIWDKNVSDIVKAFQGKTNEFQLGNAINRSKWGCQHTGDYLKLLAGIPSLRDLYPDITIGGSSVIDFEPLATLRTLFNFHRYDIDACSCALYVNRRGSPYSKQYGVFGLAEKLRLIFAMAKASNRSASRLWVTETNWPLLNTKPYTPNSGLPRSTVDEQTQARYLTEYYRIAYSLGFVERVYWWQLVNPGYGLVDHREGGIRRMPSFFAFKKLLENKA